MTFRRVTRGLAWVLAGLAAGLGSAAVVLQLAPDLQRTSRPAALAASFIPFGIGAWLAAVLLFASLRRRRPLLLAGLCVIPLALQVLWMLPWPGQAAPSASEPHLRILMLNTHYSKLSYDDLWRQLEREQPDVAVLLEAQQPLVDDLDARGARSTWPFRDGRVEPGWAVAGVESPVGTLVLSRYPLNVVEWLPLQNSSFVVRVSSPGRSVTVLAAHPRNPVHGLAGWLADADVVRDAAARHRDERLIIAGDLNSTPHHVTVRDLMALGLRSATDTSGAGYTATFPADGFAPIIQIDHILTGPGVTALGLHSILVEGSDHRGLVADLALS